MVPKVLSKCNSFIPFTLSEPYEGRTDFAYNNLLKAQVGLLKTEEEAALNRAHEMQTSNFLDQEPRNAKIDRMNQVSFSLNMIKDMNFEFHDDEIDVKETEKEAAAILQNKRIIIGQPRFTKMLTTYVSKSGEILHRTFIAP